MAPGTVASALTAAFLWLAGLSPRGVLLFVVVIVLIGIWAGGQAERAVAAKDPSIVVIDEVAGMALSVLALPPTAGVLAAGFVLFRVFDVVKPFPARRSERLGGGLGVMIDDVIAGLYALAVLSASRAALGWP